MKILVADDSQVNRFLVSSYLKNLPYNLQFVEDGRQALETYSQETFDLILMDMQMPVMDGLEATRSIRALECCRSGKSTPIVALTANTLPEDRERALAAGCNIHLSKPISKETLITAIEQLLAASSAPDADPTESLVEPGGLILEIPDGFEEVSGEYLLIQRSEVQRMIELLENQDLAALCVFGHKMKGTGTSFGFPELTRLGGQVEKAAKALNKAELSSALLKIGAYIEFASQKLAKTA